MGRYINWADVANRYPDAAKIGGAENVSSSWIYGAEAEVDARLATKYTTPFVSTPAPAIVADLSIDLTYYKATFRQKGSDTLYKYIKDRFDSLLNGTMVIEGGSVIPVLGFVALVGSRGTAFGFDDPLNWKPSDAATDLSEADRE